VAGGRPGLGQAVHQITSPDGVEPADTEPDEVAGT
jgi:hypothetical protein